MKYKQLSSSHGYLIVDDLKAADKALRRAAAKADGFELAEFKELHAFEGGSIFIPPASPVWGENFYVDDPHTASWFLHHGYSAQAASAFVELFFNSLSKFETRVIWNWQNGHRLSLSYPIRGFQYRSHAGFELELRTCHGDASISTAYRSLAPAWDVKDQLIVTANDACRFDPDRVLFRQAIFHADCETDDSAAAIKPNSLSLRCIETPMVARSYLPATLDALIGAFGEPQTVEFEIKAFNDEAAECAELCCSIAPLWSTRGYLKPKQKFDPFARPEVVQGVPNSVVRVYPVAWREYRQSDRDDDEFCNLHISVQHTHYDSRLLVYSHHSVNWLCEMFGDAGLWYDLVLLSDAEVITPLNDLKPTGDRTPAEIPSAAMKATEESQLPPFSTIKLHSRNTRDEAFDAAVAAFESAGCKVQQDERFSSAQARCYEVFFCHKKRLNGAYIVYMGDWSKPEDIHAVAELIDELKSSHGFMQFASIKIISPIPVHPVVQEHLIRRDDIVNIKCTHLRSAKGCLRSIDLQAAESALRLAAAKAGGFAVSEFKELQTFSVGNVFIPPATPYWSKDDCMEENLSASWYLHREYSPQNSNTFVDLFFNSLSNFETKVVWIWGNGHYLTLSYPIVGVQDRTHSGFYLSLRTNLGKPAEQTDHTAIVTAYSSLAPIWGVDDQLNVTGNGTCQFDPDRAIFRRANFRADCKSIVFDPVPMPDFLSLGSIESAEHAQSYLPGTLEALIDAFGEPLSVEFEISAFNDEASECAELCRSIAPLWSVRGYLKAQQKCDPYKRPKLDVGVRVYPVAWHEERRSARDMGDFNHLYLAVEHTPDDSRLLVYTHHDDDWLRSVVVDAGYADDFEMLCDGEHVTSLDAVKPTGQNAMDELPLIWCVSEEYQPFEFPKIVFSSKSTLAVVEDDIDSAFDELWDYEMYSYDLELESHKYYRWVYCTNDDSDSCDAFILHLGDWCQDAIQEILAVIEEVKYKNRFHRTTSITLFSINPVPSIVRARLKC